MKIEAILNRHVEFASPDDTAVDLAVTMGDLDVGALPVGDENELLGVVTDRDILYRVVARGLDPKTVKARDILSAPVVTCRADDTLQSAMELMAAHHVRRLPVRDASERIVGWLTLSDLSRTLLLESGSIQAALRDVTLETAD